MSAVYGRVRAKAATAQRVPSLRAPPGVNYTAGATAFAAFKNLPLPGGGGAAEYEVYVAVGRPGEPLLAGGAARGVSVLRFTTTDLYHYSAPSEVLFLENGSGENGEKANDFDVWTVKSMDRDGGDPGSARYVLLASYATGVHSFTNALGPVTTVGRAVFVPTTGDLTSSNFEDHDDANIIYHAETARWVDMQIMYETWDKRYCDNVAGARRVVSARVALDDLGRNWTSDLGCLDSPQLSERCKSGFNTSAMVRPNDAARIAQGRAPDEDPPELEFYRIRPFVMEDNKRLAAHVLLYVPAPSDVVTEPGYGRQPLWYCTSGCCHGTPTMTKSVGGISASLGIFDSITIFCSFRLFDRYNF